MLRCIDEQIDEEKNGLTLSGVPLQSIDRLIDPIFVKCSVNLSLLTGWFAREDGHTNEAECAGWCVCKRPILWHETLTSTLFEYLTHSA